MICFYGNSIRGKKHIVAQMNNQDSYHIKNTKKYSFAVVSDGLGSKSKSDYGSKTICRIAKRYIPKLAKKTLDLRGYLLILLKKWKKKTQRFGSDNCDATCLVAFVSKEVCYLAQVGDGLIACVVDNRLLVVKNKDDDFINETSSLSRATINSWEARKIDLKDHVVTNVLLATDGISNDIVEDAMKEFLEEISNEIGNSKRKINNDFLEELLTKLPNKNNEDDKTIVVGK